MQRANRTADMVISSNAVFTGREEQPRPGSVAIAGNRIIAVGSQTEIEALIGPGTKVYRFSDELVMPGFHDSHVHLILSGLYQECVNLQRAASEEEAAGMVRQFAESRPNDPWVLGFTWYHVFWKRKVLPHRSTLDRLIPDRPVFLLNYEGHGAWVNSKAFEIVQIDRNTPDPPYGQIARDADGEPTGYLYESAMGLVSKYAFAIPKERQIELIKGFLAKAARLGVTSISDMQPFLGVNLGDIDVYRTFEEKGELTCRFHVLPELNENLEYPKSLRQTYTSEKLRFSGLKQFLDGVATTYTAYMLEPYSDRPDSRGNTSIDPERIKELVVKADREGFRVRLHACGDGAVRLGLDCIEEAQRVNGTRDARHTIEHIENIHPDDIGRFARLGVIASMQPEHLAMTDVFADNPYPIRLGPERTKLTWPFKTLLNSGARLAFGTDCPVVDIDPMLEVYRAVTRLHNDGEPAGGWNPWEKLTMAEVLRGYTLGSAYQAFRDNDLGTLEEGKLADIVVLDHNLFAIPHEEIRDTKVRMTVMDGQVIFEK